MKKTLVLFAHPYFEHSNSNKELIKVYQNHPDIQFRDLYEEYPNFHIEAFLERKRIQDIERIVFHFPLIWFNMPPLLQLWIDEVMDTKWHNSDTDNPLNHKEAVIIISAGGNEDSFSDGGQYHTTLKQLSLGLKLCLETNKMLLKKEIFIYQADDLSPKAVEEVKLSIKNTLLN